jgi:hypothetical protein
MSVRRHQIPATWGAHSFAFESLEPSYEVGVKTQEMKRTLISGGLGGHPAADGTGNSRGASGGDAGQGASDLR